MQAAGADRAGDGSRPVRRRRQANDAGGFRRTRTASLREVRIQVQNDADHGREGDEHHDHAYQPLAVEHSTSKLRSTAWPLEKVRSARPPNRCRAQWHRSVVAPRVRSWLALMPSAAVHKVVSLIAGSGPRPETGCSSAWRHTRCFGARTALLWSHAEYPSQGRTRRRSRHAPSSRCGGRSVAPGVPAEPPRRGGTYPNARRASRSSRRPSGRPGRFSGRCIRCAR